MAEVSLTPLTPDTLPIAEPWFEDGETRRWLGGPGWPEIVLKLASEPPDEHRGVGVTGRFAWLAWIGEEPVGLVDVERYEDGTAGIALVVNPSMRGQSVGKRILHAVASHPELASTAALRAGIEPGNLASVACFRGAGFTAESEEPDEEGIVYFSRRVRQPQAAISREKE